MYHRLINEEEPEDHLQNDQNNFELKNRHNKERRTPERASDNDHNGKIDFIYHTVRPKETLQGIALRYGCTVSKLRFYNHLMTDHAFHGLAVLKIPVMRNGILKEKHGDQMEPPTERTPFVDDLVDLSSGSSGSLQIPKTQVVNIGISNYLNSNNGEDYRKFLNNLSEDFKEIRKLTELKMESVTLAASDPISAKVTASSSAFMSSCDGSNFGCNLRYLIIILVVVCFLVPSYVLFNLEHHHFPNSTHHNSTNSTYHPG